MRALQGWTAGVASGLTPTAGLLFAFLCRVEPEDRRQDIVEANWKDFLTRLGTDHAVAAAALAEPEQGLPAALAGLEAAGLVGVERPPIDPEQVEALKALLAGHPELAGLDPAALQGCLPASQPRPRPTPFTPAWPRPCARRPSRPCWPRPTSSWELPLRHGPARAEDGDGGRRRHGRRQRPPRRAYLLRQERWKEASTLLERMLQRDETPDTLAFALPLLRRIVEATAGTEQELSRRRHPGQDAGEGRTHRRGGADAPRRDRTQRRPGQLPARRRRPPAICEPAPEQRPPGGSAESGRGEGRLHAAGRAGAVDATASTRPSASR